MQRSFSVAIVALALSAAALFAPPTRAVVIPYAATGLITPGAACPLPLPFDCTLTSTGTYVDTTGTFGPWTLTATFTLFSANPPAPTQFANAGTVHFDDLSGNNDFFGTFTGVFDVTTFTGTLSYAITGGTGAFAGASGFGVGSVQVNPLDNTFIERGTFVIPEPATLVLLGIGLVTLVTGRMRART